MKLVIAAIKTYLSGLAAEYPPTGENYWPAAAHMSERALCGRFIAALNSSQYEYEEERPSPRMLDWRAWTPEIMDALGRVSTRFAWTVCQTSTKHACPEKDHYRMNYVEMGKDLADLINL